MLPLVAVTAALLPACLILAGHWFPWPSLLGRPLSRIEAYVFGVSCIMFPATALAVNVTEAQVVVWLYWTAAIAAGVATIGAWAIDRLIAYIHGLRDQLDEARHAPDDEQ